MQERIGPDGTGDACAAPGDPDDEALLRLTGLMPLITASHRAGTAPGTLRRHLASGACDGRKIGRRWYVNRQDVDRWTRRHPHAGSVAARPSESASDPALAGCGCDAPGRLLGGRARAELDSRARRVRALARFRELEQQVAMELLGIRGSEGLAPECRSWLDAVGDTAARDAAGAALGALLEALTVRLAVAPSSVLVSLDQAALRDAVELT